MKYNATEENKWEKLKDTIKRAAENNIGYKKKTIGNQISDVDLERMSKDQKEIRLQIENCKDTEKMKEFKKLRKKILKEMKTQRNEEESQKCQRTNSRRTCRRSRKCQR